MATPEDKEARIRDGTLDRHLAAIAATTTTTSDTAPEVVPPEKVGIYPPLVGGPVPEVSGKEEEGPDGAIGNQQFNLLLSADQSWHLTPPNPSVVTASVDGTTVTVSWSPAVITDEDGKNAMPASSVTYYVFAAEGGFVDGPAGAGKGVVPGTACGVYRWASFADFDPIAVVDTYTATIAGLSANSMYQFTVAAECSSKCFNASLPAATLVSTGKMSVEEARALDSDEASRLVGPDFSLQAPGYSVQRVAYKYFTAYTGPPSSPPTGGISGAAVGGIVFGIIAAAGGGFLYFRYKRRKTVAREYQYVAMTEMSSTMQTISTPHGGAGSGTDGSGFVAARPAGTGSSGAGVLSAIRSKLSASSATGGGRTKVPLAESSDYASIDDQVKGFL